MKTIVYTFAMAFLLSASSLSAQIINGSSCTVNAPASPGNNPAEIAMVQGTAQTNVPVSFLVQARDTFFQTIPLAGNVNLRIFYLSLKLDGPNAFTVTNTNGTLSNVCSVTSFFPGESDSTFGNTDTTNYSGCALLNISAPTAGGVYNLNITGLITGSIIVEEFPAQLPGVNIPAWPSAGDTLSFVEFDALIDAIVANPLLSAFAGLLPSFDVNRLPPGNNTTVLNITTTSLAENLAAQYNFSIAPNPATGNSRVRFELAQPEAVELHLLDATGRQVRNIAAGTLVGSQEFALCTDCSTLPAGLYLVQATIGGSSFAQRVVVQ